MFRQWTLEYDFKSVILINTKANSTTNASTWFIFFFKHTDASSILSICRFSNANSYLPKKLLSSIRMNQQNQSWQFQPNVWTLFAYIHGHITNNTRLSCHYSKIYFGWSNSVLKFKYLTCSDVFWFIKSQSQKYHIIMEYIPLERLMRILRIRYSFDRFFFFFIQVQYRPNMERFHLWLSSKLLWIRTFSVK